MHLYTGVVLLITFMHWGGQSNLTFIYIFLKGTNGGLKGNVIPSLILILPRKLTAIHFYT